MEGSLKPFSLGVAKVNLIGHFAHFADLLSQARHGLNLLSLFFIRLASFVF
jgi:hypothetical protein